MRTLTTRLVAVTGGFAISLGAAACSRSETPTVSSSSLGSGARTAANGAPAPADILARAKANALAATSAAFKGTVSGNGQQATIDFKGTTDGQKTDVKISRVGVGRARFIAFDGAMYIQGDVAFWRLQKAPAKVLANPDKYVRTPSAASAVADTLALKPMLNKIFAVVSPADLAPALGGQSVGGVDCWVVTDKKGKGEGALYVSKDKLQVVRFTGSASSPGQLDFSKWNEDLGIKAPAASQVMTIG